MSKIYFITFIKQKTEMNKKENNFISLMLLNCFDILSSKNSLTTSFTSRREFCTITL